MAGRIKWSLQATEDLQEIFSYWRRRNKSNRYGKKLNTEIKQVIKILYKYPYLGISTTDKLIRVKVFTTYKIFSNSIPKILRSSEYGIPVKIRMK